MSTGRVREIWTKSILPTRGIDTVYIEVAKTNNSSLVQLGDIREIGIHRLRFRWGLLFKIYDSGLFKVSLKRFKIDFLVDEDEDLNDRWVEDASQKRHKRSGVKVKFRIKVD